MPRRWRLCPLCRHGRSLVLQGPEGWPLTAATPGPVVSEQMGDPRGAALDKDGAPAGRIAQHLEVRATAVRACVASQ